VTALREDQYPAVCFASEPSNLLLYLCFVARCRNPTAFATFPRSRYPRLARDLPLQVRALAILVSRRTYATNTTTHGSEGSAFPPPGFDVNEAKKGPAQSQKDGASSAKDIDRQTTEQNAVDKSEATAVDKTKALENTSLSEMAEAKVSGNPVPDGKTEAKKEEEKRLTIGQKIKKELHHYWDGTKLLATEVRISSKLALKMAAGYELSRRENRQVSTRIWIARLVST
jgi:LETM1 and EF-hand domain-containing protein 1, mitochondrial